MEKYISLRRLEECFLCVYISPMIDANLAIFISSLNSSPITLLYPPNAVFSVWFCFSIHQIQFVLAIHSCMCGLPLERDWFTRG